MDKRKIAILGSTGSIGRQALEVVREHPEQFEIELLTANNSSELLIKQAIEFKPNNVVICNEAKYSEVAQALDPHYIKVFAGMDSVCDLVQASEIDIVLTAMVGFSGLRSTIAAIKAGKRIALANKETLVAAGEIVVELAKKHRSTFIPVDSEHSAIFQCLSGHPDQISKLHLTASGGPFRTWKKEDIAKATKNEALKHPKWNMGSKITIDSATMMNKGLEVIEAKWLFDTDAKNINVVIHPESIIHSMVEYIDGAIIAQLGHPDMREPIQLALSYPDRLSLSTKKLDFAQLAKLHFFEPEFDKFPALQLAYDALERGGNIPCAMNAANEAAVAAFLEDKVGFYDIPRIVENCMNNISFIKSPTIEDIFQTNDEALIYANNLIKNIK